MAFEKIGFGGILTFDVKKATANMTKARRGFSRLSGVASKLGSAVTTVAKTAIAPFGAAVSTLAGVAILGKAIHTGMKFEQQMSAVGAVLGSTQKDMQALTNSAKSLGATTSFSASQVAQGQELMARAGFGANQIMQAMPGLLNMAAAEGMGLAEATDIAASTLRGLGLPASEMATVADQLAMTAAKSNTNIMMMGESLKFAAPMAKRLHIPMNDLNAAIGILADSGIKGSMAGTNLREAFNKMAAPTAQGAKLAEKLGLTFKDAHGDMLPMNQVLLNLKASLDKIPGSMDKNAAMATLFGVRGSQAMGILSDSVDSSTKSFAQLSQTIKDSAGKSTEMALERLNNMAGVMTLLKSASEGLQIEFFGLLKGPLTGLLKPILDIASNMALGAAAFNKMRDGVALTSTELKAMGTKGFSAGFEIWDMFSSVGELFEKIGDWMKTIWEPIIGAIGDRWFSIKGVIGGIWDSLMIVMDSIIEILGVTAGGDKAFNVWRFALEAILFPIRIIGTAMLGISTVIRTVALGFQGIKLIVSKVASGILSLAQAYYELIGNQEKANEMGQAHLMMSQDATDEWNKASDAYTKSMLKADAAFSKLWGGQQKETMGFKDRFSEQIAGSKAAIAATQAKAAKEREAERKRIAQTEKAMRKKEAGKAKKECITIQNKLNVDGREASIAVGKAQMSIAERGGAEFTPWQKDKIFGQGLLVGATS